MKYLPRALVGLALLFATLFTITSPAADAPIPATSETLAQHDTRLQWWREARFGLFIHWGVYSVPAGQWQGKPIWGGGEWIMNCGQIPVADYQQLPAQFNPVKFNADDWVKAARDAGMKYIVITAKHHDGFAMFKSDASPFNIVDATPFHRDPLAELAKACRHYNLKLGFYYSQAQDWNHPGGSAIPVNGRKTEHWDPAQDGSMDDYLDKIAVPQVRELLSNYGEFPAVLWWDTPQDMTPERAAKLYAVVKSLKPNIIMNNRLGGGCPGDSETPEQTIPATGFPGRDWETCMTMNDTWGYKSDDNHWKSTTNLIHNLVDIASKGGNYLLNVGPTSEGLIPEPSLERLQSVGAWMKVNHVAIYDTTASPFKKLPWGRCTKKVNGSETTLYLHVFDWPADGRLLVPGLHNTVASARLLAGGKKLTFISSAHGVELSVPATAPDPISSTIVLNIKGTPDVTSIPIQPDPNGSVFLPASAADLQGALSYETGGGKDNIGYWTNPADTASWNFRLPHAGKFTVLADVASLGSGQFDITVGGQTLHGMAPNTGDYLKFQTIPLTGTLTLSEVGDHTLVVRPVTAHWQPLNLRSLRLLPDNN